MKHLTYTILLFFCSCQNTPYTESEKKEVLDRNRNPLYHVRVPSNWKEMALGDRPIPDTRLPIAAWVILDGNNEILIQIHTFPLQNIETHIPPIAQVQRWQRQFTKLDLKPQISPVSYSGFVGLQFEAEGIQKGEPLSVLAWALQIGQIHWPALSTDSKLLQMAADVTIKAFGPPNLIDTHKEDIERFARSFSLIEEIPNQR